MEEQARRKIIWAKFYCLGPGPGYDFKLHPGRVRRSCVASSLFPTIAYKMHTKDRFYSSYDWRVVGATKPSMPLHGCPPVGWGL